MQEIVEYYFPIYDYLGYNVIDLRSSQLLILT